MLHIKKNGKSISPIIIPYIGLFHNFQVLRYDFRNTFVLTNVLKLYSKCTHLLSFTPSLTPRNTVNSNTAMPCEVEHRHSTAQRTGHASVRVQLFI